MNQKDSLYFPIKEKPKFVQTFPSMDLHPIPYPVRSQTIKPKSTRKIYEPPKINVKGGPLLQREKRVFGTVRNPNIPLKMVPEKPAKVKSKPASVLLKKATKPPQATRSPIIWRRRPIVAAVKPPERTPTRLKKKNVCFRENEARRNGKNLDNGNASEPRTPVNAIIAKPRVFTPYHSAEKCSKCRFDKLETASYWLSQIKVSESVGRHSISAAFFGLALDCNAEPIRNLRVELKKYLVRHEHLNTEEKWRKISVSYGLAEEEGCKGGGGRRECKCSHPQNDDDDLPKQIVEEDKD